MRRIFNKRKADILVTILEKINDKNYKIVAFVDLIFKKKENAEKNEDTIRIWYVIIHDQKRIRIENVLIKLTI